MKNKNRSSLSNFVRATRGANMVEYIILVGLVALICIGGYTLFGDKVNKAISVQSTTVGNVNTAAGAAAP
jgi:pilus assembly protein Flp/PilA